MRIVSVGIAFGVIITLFLRPELGLFLVWRIVIPVVPLLFFIAPGLWRNICPLASVNQTPRLFDMTKAMTAPAWLTRWGYVIGISLFVLLVTLRKITLNYNGAALGVLLVVLLATAFAMGTVFKGKSGWCSSICPLLPVQRIYGQTPFATVPNSHCDPCVGCTKNCYDFNPSVAYMADMHDQDEEFTGFRQAFVAMFPGFVAAFYVLPDPGASTASTTTAGFIDNPLPWCDFAVASPRPTLGFLSIGSDISIPAMYGMFGLFMLAGAGLFLVARTFIPGSAVKLTTLFGALALNIYYWFNATLLGGVCGPEANMALVWAIRAVVFALTLVWIARTWLTERDYLAVTSVDVPVSLSVNRSIIAHRSSADGQPEVHFEDAGTRVVVSPGTTLLEVIEANDLPIESGCRMGVCGADPVSIVDGDDQLSRMGGDERSTIERLGLASNTRLACVAKVKGSCTVSLSPAAPAVYESSIIAGFAADPSVKSVVIVGNGIAGVTAADHVRRRHLSCDIHLISNESHHLYNRMAITRLIYGRSAMDGLYLMPDKWYDDHNITVWLNTSVDAIDIDQQQVRLGTNESLHYDKLILTTGGRGFVPPITGFGALGTFVLRSASDAMAIRSFVQQYQARSAIVAGGGLLGLEAAYAFTKLGVGVTVLERGNSLLRRQLDAEGGAYLQRYLEGLGMQIITNAECASVHGTERVEQVSLVDGRMVPADVLLVAAGVRSNTTLAEQSGIGVDRGILVNSRMETSAPNVLAAGDSVVYEGAVPGLWTVATSQGQIAAANAVGADERYDPPVPVTMLKVAGIDLTSIGRIEAEAGDETLVFADADAHQYRKLLINNGKVVGAILIGWPDEARALSEIAKEDLDVAPLLPSLREGDWAGLQGLVD